MPERIYKLQPNRTIALRGFDDLGASAAIHSATANSFKVSGVFRDPADFAVLNLYDADNFYEHPSLKYLPDFDFGGLTLTFDLKVEGLMPIDSAHFPTIDWPFLDVVTKDGSKPQRLLADYATQVSPGHVKAATEFVIQDDACKEFDRLTLWYLNLAFDYIVPKLACSFLIEGQSVGFTHTITVAGTAYTYAQQATDTNTSIAQGLVTALASCPDVSAARGDGSPDLGPVNQLNLRAARSDGSSFVVAWSTQTLTLYGVSAGSIASAFASQINATNWVSTGALIPLQAVAQGGTLQLQAAKAGVDGNLLAMYAVWKNERLRTASETALFAGGASNGTLRVTLDFAAMNIPEIRLMWLTFAPPLASGTAFQSTEWEATFTNWALTGPESKRRLQVAGPASVRVEENDVWCSYKGNWTIVGSGAVPQHESGFFSDGYAKRAAVIGDSVTIKYVCSSVHDLYLGTSLQAIRSTVGVKLDTGAETDFSPSSSVMSQNHR